MTLICIFSPFFCTTTYRWSPHPSSAGGHNMLLTKRIPRQLSVSGFLYLNPQAPGNWACNVDSNMAPSVSVGSSMAGSDSSSVTLTYWSILDSSESSLSMLSRFCPLFFRPQNNHLLLTFSLSQEKLKMATHCYSLFNPRMLCNRSEGLAPRVLALPYAKPVKVWAIAGEDSFLTLKCRHWM